MFISIKNENLKRWQKRYSFSKFIFIIISNITYIYAHVLYCNWNCRRTVIRGRRPYVTSGKFENSRVEKSFAAVKRNEGGMILGNFSEREMSQINLRKIRRVCYRQITLNAASWHVFDKRISCVARFTNMSIYLFNPFTTKDYFIIIIHTLNFLF